MKIMTNSTVAATRPIRAQGALRTMLLGAGDLATRVRTVGPNALAATRPQMFIRTARFSVEQDHPPREVLC